MSAPYQSQGDASANRQQEEGAQDFMWLGPDTMRPIPVDGSFNTMLSSSQPFHGFGSNYEANAEPLLPMEFPMAGRQGTQAQAPIFQSPGNDPMQNFGAMSGLPIPETHFMGNDSGGNDGYVLNNAVPPAVPQQPAAPAATIPRQLQLPSQILEARQVQAKSELYDCWHPDELLPEDYPELDPAYAGDDPANLPRITSNVPPEAWLPGDLYRVPTGSSIVEPASVQAENGRLYNGYREGKYFLPNDPAEQDRLDLQHQGLKILLGGKLFLAPIKNPKHVLDLATGTGIWPNEFAELYPDAQVIGSDLSQIQPDTKPPNVTFVREDSDEEWCYDAKFDFIHARLVFTCFDNPRGVLERAFENLNPGGWIEYMDATGTSGCLDGTLRGTALEKVSVYCQQGAATNGRDLRVAEKYKQWLEEIGFVDVVERKFAWPYGGWAKDPRIKLAGKFCQRDIYDGVSGIAHVMLQKAGYSNEQIEQFIAEVRRNLVDPTIHAYLPMIAVYGRKPEKQDVPRAADPEPSSNPSAAAKRAGFLPHEFLPEDFPEIDPLYLRPDTMSPAAVPVSESGIPPEAWVPAEIYRETSGASVVEPNSVVETNGRSYHGYKEGKYYLPNDAAEQERLDLQAMSTYVLLHHRLTMAPISNPPKVLDIATGTGLWAMEFAREHPESHIIGTDLSKIQPENPPENVEFIRDDAEEPWEFGPTKFDYIHARFVFSCFNDPKYVMQQAFDNMNPGGWIEYVDGCTDVVSLDGSSEGTTLERWGQLLKAGAASRGRDVEVSQHYKKWMEEIGFVEVQERKYAGVIGPWCKEERMKHVGRLSVRNLYDNISGLSYRMFSSLGYTAEQIEEFAMSFRADLLSPAIHAYIPMYVYASLLIWYCPVLGWVVYGRKPHAWETKTHPATSESGTTDEIQ
ncbi:Secondary metabolism regulator LAE1 [Apiospora marii]|uniref:Secondary metabolism regulator LAE1 n=1 Tax=Apiospora marii TaxID=335849 RepID=UPI0031301166